jgi:hypothetical protein
MCAPAENCAFRDPSARRAATLCSNQGDGDVKIDAHTREVLAAYLGVDGKRVRDETLLREELGVDVMDLARAACRFEEDHNLRDEVPAVLLADVRTVREFIELVDGWHRDTLLELEPATQRNGHTLDDDDDGPATEAKPLSAGHACTGA